jgi:hypothetical protein
MNIQYGMAYEEVFQYIPLGSLPGDEALGEICLSLKPSRNRRREMLKKTGFRLLGLVIMVSILFVAQAQTEEQGWKKTITLSSGEVVCDLNGEWDLIWIGRGEWQGWGQHRDVVKIVQQGNSFEGILMIGNPYNLKGEVGVVGDLDTDGFKKLMFKTVRGYYNHKGKISKDGNKIEFNERNLYEVELTRK